MCLSVNRRQILAATASAAFPALSMAAPQSTTPSASGGRGIRLVVPFAPGGVIDALARPLVERLQDRFGPLHVDNIVGLRGSAGAAFVAKAAPDGNTLLLGSVITQAINPWIGAAKLYDPVRDFTPIALLARISNVLVISTETSRRLNINSVAELVLYARSHPGRLTYGSPGMGTTSHLAPRCSANVPVHRSTTSPMWA